MTIDDFLDLLEETLEDGKHIMNKIMVDGDRIKEIIEDIRLYMPEEIRKAKKIVEDRSSILERAAIDAESTIKKAEAQQQMMVSESEVLKIAQAQANALMAKATAEANDKIADANAKATSIQNSATKFIDDLMKQADETLYETMSEVRRARQSFKNVSSQAPSNN